MNSIRVLAADAHAVVRAGVKALVDAQPGMAVVGEAADGLSAVRLEAVLNPNVIVTEILLPHLDGIHVTARVRAGRPNQKVLALTACEEASTLRRLLHAGAAGCVLKRAPAEEFLQALRTVAAGGTYLDPTIADRVRSDPLAPESAPTTVADGLSAREREVVRQIARGYNNKEIAASIKISVKSVETYKARSMEKLGLRGRVDIVRYALGRGWLNDEVPSSELPIKGGSKLGAPPAAMEWTHGTTQPRAVAAVRAALEELADGHQIRWDGSRFSTVRGDQVTNLVADGEVTDLIVRVNACQGQLAGLFLSRLRERFARHFPSGGPAPGYEDAR